MKSSAFGFKCAEDSPGFMLWQTTVTWQRLIKKTLEPFGISHAQFVIMAILLWFEEHAFDTTQVLISTWSKLDKMTVSKSLKKLSTQKLVSRMEHETDTRAKKIKLTNKGRSLVQKLVPLVEKVDADFFDTLSSKDQKALIKKFNKLTNRSFI